MLKNKCVLLYMDSHLERSKAFNEVLKHRKYLDSIFYGEGLLMKSFPIFYSFMIGSGIPYDICKFYYDNQAIVQIFKPPESMPVLSNPIISLLPFERVFIDTMYLTQSNSTLGFINVVDVFSKYAYSKVFVLGKKVSAISSNKASTMFNDFLSEIKEFNIPLGIVYSDRGPEFQGDFQKDLEGKKIIQVFANAGDKRKMSPIERFNKTLRLMIEKYKVIYGNINSNVLNIIMKSYNNIRHAKLKYSPLEILKSKDIQDIITSTNYKINQNTLRLNIPLKGYCRILISKTFKKVSPIWSTTLYKVLSSINGNYKLEGLPGYYKYDELQHVDTDFLMSHKVTIHDKEEESENIIKEEPIYEGRVLRNNVKVDYKKLSKG